MIDLIHILEFSDRYKHGWRMVPGYELKAGDTRVVMAAPRHPDDVYSNRSARAVSRCGPLPGRRALDQR